MNAIDEIQRELLTYMTENKLSESSFINETFIDALSQVASDAMTTYKVSDKASLHAWETTRDTLKNSLKLIRKETDQGIITNGIRDTLRI